MTKKIGKYLLVLIIGLVLGFSLSIPMSTNAGERYNPSYAEELLEEIRDNGDDILGKMETINDSIRNIR